MKKRISVSIGIPAFNEQANITHLLNSLIAQNQINFKLKEIIVVNDGSTDQTNKQVESFKDSRLTLIKGAKRLGQQVRQNQLLREYKGKILVIIEADTLPANKKTINELIKPFIKDKKGNLGMVVGNHLAIKPKSFLEHILYHAFILKKEIFLSFKNGLNIYTASGHAMKAISKKFAKNLYWPSQAPEDAYTYLRLKSLNLEIKRAKKAKVYFRNVTNYSDRIKQVTKYISGKETPALFFDKELVKNEYSIPLFIQFQKTIKALGENPFWISLYLLEVLVNRLMTAKKAKFTHLNQTYQSSKVLINI